MIADYHIHTRLCKHALGEMEEYVEYAIEIGLKEIAFSDHIPLPNNFDIAHRMAEHELEWYMKKIRRLQEQYPELTIKAGIEADFYNGFEEYLYQIINHFEFDIIIMSVHFVKGWEDNNWTFSYYFPDKSLKQVYSEYLQSVICGIKTGLFNIVGHLDLIKSPENAIVDLNENEVRDVLQEAKTQNMAIELNTSGLRRHINEVYPDLKILPLIIEEKLPVTFGSDAHKPEDVGFYFKELEQEVSVYPEIKFAQFDNGRMRIFQNLQVDSK